MRISLHHATHCGRAVIAALFSTLIATDGAMGQDSPRPVPKVHKDGPSLRFDFPEMMVGIAEYEEGPTGCPSRKSHPGSSSA